MPRFYEETEINIDVDEFLSRCSAGEIKELVKSLKEDGHLPEQDLPHQPTSPMEGFFELSLNKLHGSYHLLGTEDIEVIGSIAKRI